MCTDSNDTTQGTFPRHPGSLCLDANSLLTAHRVNKNANSVSHYVKYHEIERPEDTFNLITLIRGLSDFFVVQELPVVQEFIDCYILFRILCRVNRSCARMV